MVRSKRVASGRLAALVAAFGARGRPAIVVQGVCTPHFYYTRWAIVKCFSILIFDHR